MLALTVAHCHAPPLHTTALLFRSGGLDTSCILQWLLDEGYSVQAFIADLGQEEDFDAAREKALKIGAEKVHTVDLKEDFLMNYIVPAIKVRCDGGCCRSSLVLHKD